MGKAEVRERRFGGRKKGPNIQCSIFKLGQQPEKKLRLPCFLFSHFPSSVLQSLKTVFLIHVFYVAISITHFLTGCYRIGNDEGQRGKQTMSFHAMEDPAHAGPHCGKRGSRSVDLPVRASSSSVARLLLLGAPSGRTYRKAVSFS